MPTASHEAFGARYRTFGVAVEGLLLLALVVPLTAWASEKPDLSDLPHLSRTLGIAFAVVVPLTP